MYKNYIYKLYIEYYVNSILPIHPFPIGIHTFVRYVCVSISALQVGSSVPFF